MARESLPRERPEAGRSRVPRGGPRGRSARGDDGRRVPGEGPCGVRPGGARAGVDRTSATRAGPHPPRARRDRRRTWHGAHGRRSEARRDGAGCYNVLAIRLPPLHARAEHDESVRTQRVPGHAVLHIRHLLGDHRQLQVVHGLMASALGRQPSVQPVDRRRGADSGLHLGLRVHVRGLAWLRGGRQGRVLSGEVAARSVDRGSVRPRVS